MCSILEYRQSYQHIRAGCGYECRAGFYEQRLPDPHLATIGTARPGKVGSEAVISVTAQIDGRPQSVGSMTFRVRKLPDPNPFIPIKDAQGNTVHYKGSPKKISKAALMAAEQLGAASTTISSTSATA